MPFAREGAVEAVEAVGGGGAGDGGRLDAKRPAERVDAGLHERGKGVAARKREAVARRYGVAEHDDAHRVDGGEGDGRSSGGHGGGVHAPGARVGGGGAGGDQGGGHNGKGTHREHESKAGASPTPQRAMR